MTQPKDDLTTLVHGLRTLVSPFKTFLNECYQSCKTIQDGSVADTVPELSKANPDWFGICVVHTNGQAYEVGDYAKPFTIQGIARPFVYGLTLEMLGRETVLQHISIEPTYESIDSFLFGKHRPILQNPLLNGGSIVSTSIIPGSKPTDRLHHILTMFRRYIGHEVQIDAPTFVSTRINSHRYTAMAHLLFEIGAIHHDNEVTEVLDLFYQQHSILVTCHDLAIMAATLANKGINPITGERAIEEQYIADILSLMFTSGMHEYTGTWSYRVGLPGKSGISGGIIAVVPQQIGIAVFSPRLNPQRHSVRGIVVCEELAKEFGLHIFHPEFGGKKLHEAMTDRPTTRTHDAKSRIARALE